MTEKEQAPTKSRGVSKSVDTLPPREGSRCYNFQMFGHVARDCTQPRKPFKCGKCKQEGHSKYCQSGTTDVNLVSTRPKNSALLYIKEVRINDHKDLIHRLVDTGSAVSMIKKSVAERFGLTINTKKINMWVYGKAQPVISKGETEANICVDEVKEHVKLVVVNDELQQYDIIIGRSFTELDNVTFIKTSDQLIFGYGMKFPYQETDVLGQITNRHAVRIKCETEIMPVESAKVVEVLADNETIEVMIINDGESELRLHRGDHVGVQREQHPSRQSVIAPRTPITAKMVQHGPDFNQE